MSRLRMIFMMTALTLLGALAACQSGPEEVELPPTVMPPTATHTATPFPSEEADQEPADSESTEAPTSTPEPIVKNYEPIFAEGECSFFLPQAGDVRCGELIVPENRATYAETGRTISLSVAIFPSESPNPASDPILYLSGGPGGSAIDLIEFSYESDVQPFLAERDYIVLDQRGTGQSEPSLFCTEVYDLTFDTLDQVFSDEEELAIYGDALTACNDRLQAEGIDLSAYNSAENVADLEDLRLLLEIESWNLFGVSYGTRVAQTYARDFPAGLRSMILDSPVPIDLDLQESFPVSTSEAFRRFFDECAADAACAETYPDLEETLYALVDELNETPAEFSIEYFWDGETYDIVYTGENLLNLLFQSLYSDEIFPLMPRIIYEVNEGDYGSLSLLVNSLLVNDEFLSVGLYYSTYCREEMVFADPAEVEAASTADEALVDYFSDWEAGFIFCDLWESGTADAIEDQPIDSDIPSLILVGGFDPVTPLSLGEEVAAQLSNSVLILVPQVGHAVVSSDPCAVDIANQFLTAPDNVPNAACIQSISDPAFVDAGISADATLDLVPFESDLLVGIVEGVAVDGWEELFPGSFARQRDGLDQTALIYQAFPPATLRENEFVSLFTEQIGGEAAELLGTTGDSRGRTWTLSETSTNGLPVMIATTEDEDALFAIILIVNQAERDFFYESLLIPATEALGVKK